MDITPADLLSYNKKKDCQARCGVYCTINTSLFVNHPWRFLGREVSATVSNRLQRIGQNRPQRIRDLPAVQ